MPDYMPYMARFNKNTALKLAFSAGTLGQEFVCSFWYISTGSSGVHRVLTAALDGGLATEEGVYFEPSIGRIGMNYQVTSSFDSAKAATTLPLSDLFLNHILLSMTDNGSTISLKHTQFDSENMATPRIAATTVTGTSNIDLCTALFVGRRGAGTAYLDGWLGDFWYKSGPPPDIFNSAVQLTFRDSNGHPIDPGVDGTGYGYGVPDVFLGGRDYALDDWNAGTNRGSLGNFTREAALLTSGYGILPKTITAIHDTINGSEMYAIGGAITRTDQDLVHFKFGAALKSIPSDYVDDSLGLTTVLDTVADLSDITSTGTALDLIHISNNNDTFILVADRGVGSAYQVYKLYKNPTTANKGSITPVLKLGNSGSNGLSGFDFPLRRELTQASLLNCWNATDGHFMIMPEYKTGLTTRVTALTNPLDTTVSSTTVTINHTAHSSSDPKVAVGSSVKMSGFTGTLDGIPAAELNGWHTLTAVTTNSYSFTVTTAATAGQTGIGGSVSAQQNSGLLRVWRSNALGDTWSVFWELQGIDTEYSAGVNFAHIHGVSQNPYTGNLVFFIGDATDVTTTVTGPSELSKRTDWATIDGSLPADIVADVATLRAANPNDGWYAYTGFQRYRGISTQFAWGYMYCFPDAGDQSNTGEGTNDVAFWRWPHDLSTAPILLKQFPRHDADAAGFVGGALGGGGFHPHTAAVEDLSPGNVLYMSEFIESAVEPRVNLYAMPNFRGVYQVGFVGLVPSSSKMTYEWFSIDDLGRIWVSGQWGTHTDDGLNSGYIFEESTDEWANADQAVLRINKDGPV